MGLEGIHLPKTLRWQSSFSFSPWCGKEGQNEGMVVNHLLMHLHLGLICAASTFLQWAQTPCGDMPLVCKSTTAGDSNSEREESPEEDNNSNDDFLFGFNKG